MMDNMSMRQDGKPFPNLMKEAGKKKQSENMYGSLNGALDMNDVGQYNQAIMDYQKQRGGLHNADI